MVVVEVVVEVEHYLQQFYLSAVNREKQLIKKYCVEHMYSILKNVENINFSLKNEFKNISFLNQKFSVCLVAHNNQLFLKI